MIKFSIKRALCAFLCVTLSLPAFGMLRTMRKSVVSRFASRFATPFLGSKTFAVSARPQMHGLSRVSAQKFNSGANSGHSHKQKDSKFFNNPHARWTLAGVVGLGLMTTVQVQKEETTQDERYKHVGPWEEQRKAYYKTLEDKPWGAVSKKYIKELQDKEDQLWDEFYQMTGVTKPQIYSEVNTQAIDFRLVDTSNWSTKSRNTYDAWVGKQTNIEHFDTSKLAKNTLKEVGIDNVPVVGYNFEHLSAAIVTFAVGGQAQYTMCLCDSILHCKDVVLSKALVMHEIQHLLHNDGCVSMLVENVLEQVDRNEDNTNQSYFFLKKFNKFLENRADILAALNDEQYPLSCENADAAHPENLKMGGPFWPLFDLFYKVCVTTENLGRIVFRLPLHIDIEHPSAQERVEYFKKLHKEMQEAMRENQKKNIIKN